MTLAEAITIAMQEYDAEVAAFTPEYEARATRKLMDEMGSITQCSEILAALVGDGKDALQTAILSIRFGMRVQRKLDNPHQTTTIFDKPRSAA
jgi:hypothetical protein